MTVLYRRSCSVLFCLAWVVFSVTNLSAYTQLSLDTSRVHHQIRTLQVRPATCLGLSDGVAEVQIKSVLTPIFIEWDEDPRLNTQRVSGLSPGKHWVTISDASGNIFTDSVLIEARFSLEAEAMVLSDVSDEQARDGIAGVMVLSAQGNVSYSWEEFPSHNDPVIGGLDVGMYTVTITDQLGCETTEAVSIIQNTPTPQEGWPLDLTQYPAMNLFPNPTSGHLEISYPEEISSPFSLRIFDLTGKEVFLLQEKIHSGSKIDIGHLPIGIYSAFLENSESRYTTKLLVK
ncbi:MAG: T9SS type A sorting domain-containing protein [Bacteroidota bacterium]